MNEDDAHDKSLAQRIYDGQEFIAKNFDENGPFFYGNNLSFVDINIGVFLVRFS